MIVPSTLAPHDWHFDGEINHDLYAEIIGLDEPSSSIFSFGGRSSSPKSKSRSRSPPGSSLLAASPSLTTTRQEVGIPRAPSYAESEASNQVVDGAQWLKGTYEVKRTMMFVYNPNPNGGVVVLDERPSGSVPGLGLYQVEFSSDVVSFPLSAVKLIAS